MLQGFLAGGTVKRIRRREPPDYKLDALAVLLETGAIKTNEVGGWLVCELGHLILLLFALPRCVIGVWRATAGLSTILFTSISTFRVGCEKP
jgi:hypothetical protein